MAAPRWLGGFDDQASWFRPPSRLLNQQSSRTSLLTTAPLSLGFMQRTVSDSQLPGECKNLVVPHDLADYAAQATLVQAEAHGENTLGRKSADRCKGPQSRHRLPWHAHLYVDELTAELRDFWGSRRFPTASTHALPHGS